MAKITYDDKSYLNLNGNIPNVNKVTDNDMNEIKSVVNSNYDSEQDDIYYKTGDTFSIVDNYGGYYTGGAISGSNKSIVWSIVVPKSLKNITSITVNSMTLTIRHSSGGYIYSSASLSQIDGNIVPYIVSDNMITFVNERTTAASGATNNTPVVVGMTCDIEFS